MSSVIASAAASIVRTGSPERWSQAQLVAALALLE
jgi:hypothetical protein